MRHGDGVAYLSLMKTFLVGIDFTEADDVVLAKAVEVVKAFGGVLHLVHVFPPEITPIDYVAYLPEDPEQRNAQFLEEERALERLAEDAATREGIAVESKMVVEKPMQGLLDHAEEIGADAIVMGTHSQRLRDRLFLGSTAERVIRKSVIPVIVVPTVQEEEPVINK